MTYQGPMDYEVAQKLTCFCVGEGEKAEKVFRELFGK